MARKINKAEHQAKRNKILDVTYQLIMTKGFGQMSVQNILDELDISRGAFFHYFRSKDDLLEPLIERMLDHIEQQVVPVVKSERSAVNKLQAFFNIVNETKTDQRQLFLQLIEVWYSDDNVLVRQKVRIQKIKRFEPLLRQVIVQGIEENSITGIKTEHTAEVVLCLLLDLSDAFASFLLTRKDDSLDLETKVFAYTQAIERIVGLPAHSLCLMDNETIQMWGEKEV
ncbi:TetR/AcrR family transcriptional regulator [Evansella halocellulosilytica]|uniref:TetR/AcrR family transcriptional regulator n=1 Tax=Evansella halocellulosilytica TaxID=2011013 RepID=UPI000BB93219|nr:TetR/AcrR family transcriptional regulator [Evansella halocellulosilytica]